MVVRYENMWIAIPSLLIIVMYVVLMMGITRIWMFGAPRRERKYPQYSLHMMYEPPPKHIQRLQNTTPSSGGLPGYPGAPKGYPPPSQRPPQGYDRPKLQPQAPRPQAQAYGYPPNTGYATPPYDPRSNFV